MLDVLMYLVDFYSDDEDVGEADRAQVELELVAAGFSRLEINKAMTWLEGLAEQGLPSTQRCAVPEQEQVCRLFSPTEVHKIGVEGQGFLMRLMQAGALGWQELELIMDRLAALDCGTIELDQLRWLVMMVLLNQPGWDGKQLWLEEMVYAEQPCH